MRALTARGQATRDKLVEAAREVFAERGFAGTRMGDLTDAAGVAHGTVYTYFDTKEDVLLAVLESVIADLHAAMKPPNVRDPIARVEAANRAYLDGYRTHAHLLRVAQEASAADPRFAEVLLDLRRTHVARVATAIRKLQSDGLASPDLDAHTAAAALCGMVEGFAAHWLGRGESHDEGTATRTLTQLWVRGLGMPARIQAQARSAAGAPVGRGASATPGPATPAPAVPASATPAPAARAAPQPRPAGTSPPATSTPATRTAPARPSPTTPRTRKEPT
jgi:AcrR family transcriptional regulator